MTPVNGSSPIRVIVVDDQELVRSGLRRILRRRDGLEIVAECADGSEVVAALDANPADVVVMDLRMRRSTGSLPPAWCGRCRRRRRCWC